MTTDQTFADYQKSEASATEKPLTAAMQRRRANFDNVQPRDPHFRAHVPVDFHPDTLDMNNGLVATAKGHHALDALWQVHTKLIQTALAVQNKAELAKQVEPAVLRAIKSMKEEVAGLDRQHAHHAKELASSLGTGVGMLQAELRSICRDLPEAERISFARSLLASGDVESVKALAAVSPVLSGLDSETYAWFRGEAERLVNPKAYAERDAAAVARDRCQRALSDFDETMSKNIARWRSGDDQRIADLMSSLSPKKEAE